MRLRRKIGSRPGVAAGVLALAYFAAEHGSADGARTLLAEARSIAEGCGAAGVVAWVDSVAAGSGSSQSVLESQPVDERFTTPPRRS